MQSRRGFLTAAGAALLTGCRNGDARFPYQNEKLSVDKRLDDLLGRMTADERSALLLGQAVPRLDIPALRPVPAKFSGIALAATWNPEMATLEGQASAREALAQGHFQVLGPTVQDF